MKSFLGLFLSLCAAGAFGLAYWLGVRAGASWMDGQWLFLAALPYTWTALRLWGTIDFSPDASVEVAAALLFDVALAYFAGALVGALARRLWRMTKRASPRA